jgi:hypothetical protein
LAILVRQDEVERSITVHIGSRDSHGESTHLVVASGAEAASATARHHGDGSAAAWADDHDVGEPVRVQVGDRDRVAAPSEDRPSC